MTAWLPLLGLHDCAVVVETWRLDVIAVHVDYDFARLRVCTGREWLASSRFAFPAQIWFRHVVGDRGLEAIATRASGVSAHGFTSHQRPLGARGRGRLLARPAIFRQGRRIRRRYQAEGSRILDSASPMLHAHDRPERSGGAARLPHSIRRAGL